MRISRITLYGDIAMAHLMDITKNITYCGSYLHPDAMSMDKSYYNSDLCPICKNFYQNNGSKIFTSKWVGCV